jgi:hypothetical protein
VTDTRPSSLNTGTPAETQSKRGGRRPGAGRPRAPGIRQKPEFTAGEEVVFQTLREAVNRLLDSDPAPSMADIAGALARLLARARALQREAGTK